jgi:hypothetical protein
MSRILIISLLLVNIFQSSVFAQNILKHKDISNQQNCYSGVFEYDTWFAMMKKSNQRKAKIPEELAIRLNKLRIFFPEIDFYKYKESMDCITFKYPVGDLLVDGYLIKPKGQKNLPIIVYNRGGNSRYGAMVFGSIFNSLFSIAENGFTVIGSQYRGVFDKKVVLGKYDEFGGAGVADVVKLLSFIPDVDGVDSDESGNI